MQSSARAADVVLFLAKQLHRAAASDSLALSLPVLRRLLSAGVLHGITLPQLRRQRTIVQRKHLLRLLALEAGFPGWEAYREALACMAVEQVAHFDMLRGTASQLNLWFSSPAETQAHVDRHGGRLVPVGAQAAVLAESVPA